MRCISHMTDDLSSPPAVPGFWLEASFFAAVANCSTGSPSSLTRASLWWAAFILESKVEVLSSKVGRTNLASQLSKFATSM
jgi:hypothetical protein